MLGRDRSVRRGRRSLAALALFASLVVGASFAGEHLAPAAVAAPTTAKPTAKKPKPGRAAPAAPAFPRNLSPTAKAECAGSQFVTLGVLFDSVFDSFLPILPAQIKKDAPAIKARARGDMKRLKISTLWISNHPYDMKADDDDPIMRYRDPISQHIVTQLVRVRNGETSHAISADNLTLAQAVETIFLYLYVTVLVPATIFRKSVPKLLDIGPIGLGTLISIPVILGVVGLTQLYKRMSVNLTLACIASVTDEEKAVAGKIEKDLRFAWAVPPMIRDIANEVSVADAENCRHIGTLPLKRIVARTSTFLQRTNPELAPQVRDVTRQLNLYMRNTRLHHNWIPADPADFNTAEWVLSQVSYMIPVVGGAPIEALIGLNRNHLDKLDFNETVPLSELTVSHSLTAAYYAYSLTAHVIEAIWTLGAADQASGLLSDIVNADIAPNLMPRTTGILTAPNFYGLVVFHNVLRSVCLDEDRTGPNIDNKSHNRRRYGIVHW
ncbi:hypothetical protein GOARA_058_00090 [Gordonia araii NBRC 100433]|uniref:Uncharacterized protein n=1 Tax=Gordonia araii NBRC 100433 TaxID=1073574 RepID=G7H3V1_9ACTN|nr:hypothetical protein [Gordonia araii]GAB10526.1 hypothetical protein GOARA_058_00090 [Gordonia araii NBRC 100433]